MTNIRQGFLSRLAHDTRGNTMILAAAALMPIAGLIGSAIDIGVAYTTRAKLQNACDAAILAGRQSMEGGTFANGDVAEAERFFEFNFPDGTNGSENVVFTIEQNPNDSLELFGRASLDLPTSIMAIFGFDTLPISVECSARRDQIDNDIVLVLDVTGSMADAPSSGGSPKIDLLRDGTSALYRALEGDDLATTRYGIVSYSHTVNVGRSLQNRDIVREQAYIGLDDDDDPEIKTVNINESSWNIGKGGGNSGGNTQGFRTSGDACIEERPSIGSAADPARYTDTITVADVDSVPANANDSDMQFGRYDPPVHDHTDTFTFVTSNGSEDIPFYEVAERWVQTGCPSESSTLAEYDDEEDFNDAIDAATDRVTGGTYHDIGMLWGLRYISRDGFFAAENPEERNDVPVRQHIIFMTDGELDTGMDLYSAFGIESIQERIGAASEADQATIHINRFKSACNVARAKGITVWVIALDVTDVDDIRTCATSDGHFFVSDGSDLEDVFAAIGNGIGFLRLTE